MILVSIAIFVLSSCKTVFCSRGTGVRSVINIWRLALLLFDDKGHVAFKEARGTYFCFTVQKSG